MNPAPTILLDTGPWVALHCRGERNHAWAVEQFATHAPPFITCEAVVTETCFLLARAGFDPAKALAEEAGAAPRLFERYDKVPALLADIRLS